MDCLLKPTDVDALFRWPRGKAARLARDGTLPHVTLPDGSIRFNTAEVEKLVGRYEPQDAHKVEEVSHAD